MYTSPLFHAKIRDTTPPYGEDWLARERFSAEGVLRDLRRATAEADTLRIVARYCAVRFLLLRDAGAPATLVSHARDAAAAHLAVTAPGWAEGASLRRLVAGPEPAEAATEPATALLVAAAREAEDAGHLNGALSARRAAYALARRTLPPRRAIQLARGLAAFLDRHGERAGAAVWRRRAHRLELRAGGGGSARPPGG